MRDKSRWLVIKCRCPFPERCGRGCPFCRFDWSDDLYHCLFFNDDPDDIAAINSNAEERDQYEKCPVKPVARDKESILELI